MAHLDDVLQLSGLLFHFGGQEQAGSGNRLTTKQPIHLGQLHKIFSAHSLVSYNAHVWLHSSPTLCCLHML